MAAPSVLLDTRRTTNPQVAVENLQASIDAIRARLARDPNNLELQSALVDRLLVRTAFLGSYDDFQEMDRLTQDALDLHPDAVGAITLRAAFLSAVHRFVEAGALLDAASAAGAEAGEIERSRIVVDLSRGVEPSSLVPRAEALVRDSATYARLNALASVYSAAGRFQEADDTYVRAIEAYRDVSPFALAWSSFTRGVMWGEAAERPDLAIVLYRDAVSRLPQYVVANVHLSELEEPESAIVRLEDVVSDSGDPEPAGKLADRLTESEPERAEQLREAAAARYDALLNRNEEAFLDHGAEFFSGPGGDPQRGLEMALENVVLRPTPRAYIVAIRAARAAEDQAVACALIEASAAMQARHPALTNLATESGRRCR